MHNQPPHSGTNMVRLHPGLRLQVRGTNGLTTLTPDNALSLAGQLLQEGREAIYQARKSFAQCPQTLMLKSLPEGCVLQMSGGDTELTATLNLPQSEALAQAAASKNAIVQFIGTVTTTTLKTPL